MTQRLEHAIHDVTRDIQVLNRRPMEEPSIHGIHLGRQRQRQREQTTPTLMRDNNETREKKSEQINNFAWEQNVFFLLHGRQNNGRKCLLSNLLFMPMLA